MSPHSKSVPAVKSTIRDTSETYVCFISWHLHKNTFLLLFSVNRAIKALGWVYLNTEIEG